MTEVSLHLRENIDWNDSLVMLAFPSVGSAASIASHYLRRKLDLPFLGSLHLKSQGPIAAVEAGLATSPLRIHGGQVECNLGDQRCPSIYLISCDVGLNPEALQSVSEAIMAATRGARLVLALDAVIRDKGDETPDVYCAASTEQLVKELSVSGTTPMTQALLVGMSGEILLAAEAGDLPAGALLVEALEDVPDGRAAAALVHAVDQMLPTVKIDAEPLMAEAMELEAMMAEAQAKAARSQAGRPPSHTYI